jgi:hypothetical protein
VTTSVRRPCDALAVPFVVVLFAVGSWSSD